MCYQAVRVEFELVFAMYVSKRGMRALIETFEAAGRGEK